MTDNFIKLEWRLVEKQSGLPKWIPDAAVEYGDFQCELCENECPIIPGQTIYLVAIEPQGTEVVYHFCGECLQLVKYNASEFITRQVASLRAEAEKLNTLDVAIHSLGLPESHV